MMSDWLTCHNFRLMCQVRFSHHYQTLGSVWSTLIGREATRLGSHWSRWFIVLLHQSYAIKNQLKAPKAPCTLWHKTASGAIPQIKV